ncbi:DUF2961 domain-containing protein [Olivibacter sp. SDN3]|nr:DUF2961 domain-containing protein [Olivibacter sp. SDN3]
MSRRKALAAVAGFAVAPTAFTEQTAQQKAQAFLGPTPLYTVRDSVSRQFTTFDQDTKIKAAIINPGEKAILADYAHPGIITRLWLTCSGWFWENWDLSKERWPDPTILKKLILRIYWDGKDFPSVEAPIGDFFGIGHCEYKHFLSNYIGMSSGGFYSYFPMPFEKVRIEVENLHDHLSSSVFLNANYDALETLPANSGRFHCLYSAGTNPGYEPLNILEVEGRGHFVGCCLSMQSWLPNYLGYLEAPEFVYIDTKDQSKPTIVGSGLEDYFNGGWYFREGEFYGPYHGVPIKDPHRSMVSMYRFHDQDAIAFQERISFSFINPRPADQTREFKFSSAAYWYQDTASPLAKDLPHKDQLVDWYRMRDTDHQAIP